MKSPMKEFLWCVCIHKQRVLTCRPQTAWTSLPVIRSQSLINTWQLCAFPWGLINENFKADYILQTWCPDAHVFLSSPFTTSCNSRKQRCWSSNLCQCDQPCQLSEFILSPVNPMALISFILLPNLTFLLWNHSLRSPKTPAAASAAALHTRMLSC